MKPYKFGIEHILKHLPHRYPFLLVDSIIDLIPNKKVVALKNVSINEPYFNGHFPGRPIMPGVLILEALAQAAILLTVDPNQEPDTSAEYYFTGIEKASFKKPVVPGDQLMLTVDFERKKLNCYCFRVCASVSETIVVEALIKCAVLKNNKPKKII